MIRKLNKQHQHYIHIQNNDNPNANQNHMSSSRETSHGVQMRSRYGRIIKPMTRIIESREQARTRNNQNVALCSSIEDYNESLHVDHKEIINSMENPMALISQVGNTMHLHQAMKSSS